MKIKTAELKEYMKEYQKKYMSNSKRIFVSIPIHKYLKNHKEKTGKSFSDIIKDLIKYRIEHQKCHT